jgi:mannitol 2-dehydrogenase
MADILASKAKEGRKDPTPLPSIAEMFGQLVQNESLVVAVGSWLASLYETKARIVAGAGKGLFRRTA